MLPYAQDIYFGAPSTIIEEERIIKGDVLMSWFIELSGHLSSPAIYLASDEKRSYLCGLSSLWLGSLLFLEAHESV